MHCLHRNAFVPPDKLAQLKQIADEHLWVVSNRQHDEITREADRDENEMERYTGTGFNLEEFRSCGLMRPAICTPTPPAPLPTAQLMPIQSPPDQT